MHTIRGVLLVTTNTPIKYELTSQSLLMDILIEFVNVSLIANNDVCFLKFDVDNYYSAKSL